MKTALVFLVGTALAVLLIGSMDTNQGSHQIIPVNSTLTVEQVAAPVDLLAADIEPRVIRSAPPVYPCEALRAGLEGEVLIKVLINTDGKPLQVMIVRSDSEIFNQASIDAAKQFLFSPAYIRDRPVQVWVKVPFKYKIADKT